MQFNIESYIIRFTLPNVNSKFPTGHQMQKCFSYKINSQNIKYSQWNTIKSTHENSFCHPETINICISS